MEKQKLGFNNKNEVPFELCKNQYIVSQISAKKTIRRGQSSIADQVGDLDLNRHLDPKKLTNL